MNYTSPKSHVFIVGCPRSGTSLLWRTIYSHTLFTTFNDETYFFTLRDIFKDGINGVSQEKQRKIRSSSSNLINFFDNLVEHQLEINKSKRLVEKTPAHVFHIKYIIHYFPEAKIINITRDPRDCYLSHLKLPVHLQRPLKEFIENVWVKSLDARLSIGKSSGIMDVKYEDFVRNPANIMQNVMSFIGEDYQHQQLLSSTQKILTTLSASTSYSIDAHEKLHSDISIDSIGRFKTGLDNNQILEINTLVSKALLQTNRARTLKVLGLNLQEYL